MQGSAPASDQPLLSAQVGHEQMEQSCPEGLGGAVGERLDMPQPWHSQPREPNVSWAASRAPWAAGQGGDSAPLLSLHETIPVVLDPSLVAPTQEVCGLAVVSPDFITKMIREV